MPYYLTDKDRETINRLADFANKFVPQSTSREAPELPTAPEVYIARTPAGGIPALTEGSDTGTDDAGLADDVPGTAECDIWKVILSGSAASVEKMGDFSKTVVNMSTTVIGGDEWIIVVREKGGPWLAVVSGGGGGGSLIVRETETDTGTSPDGPEIDPCDTIEFDTDNFDIDEEPIGTAQVKTRGLTTTKTVVVDCDTGEVTIETWTFTNGLLTSAS